MRLSRLVAASVLLVLVATTAAAADVYEVDPLVQDEIGSVRARTDVPVRLPRVLNLDYDGPVYADGSASSRRYEVDLNATEECGANACFLAQMSGERGGSFAFTRQVSLARGLSGRYKPLTCGGSCSPPTIEWKQGGNLYRIQAKVGIPGRKKQRRHLIRAANQAIRNPAT